MGRRHQKICESYVLDLGKDDHLQASRGCSKSNYLQQHQHIEGQHAEGAHQEGGLLPRQGAA